MTQLKFRDTSPISDIDSSDGDSDTIIQDLTRVEDTTLRAGVAKSKEPLVNGGKEDNKERDTRSADEAEFANTVDEDDMSSSLSSESLVYPRGTVASLPNLNPVSSSSNHPDVIPVIVTSPSYSACLDMCSTNATLHMPAPLTSVLSLAAPTHTLLPTDTSSSAGEDSDRASPSPPKVETVECISSNRTQHTEPTSETVQFVVSISASTDLKEEGEEREGKDNSTQEEALREEKTALSEMTDPVPATVVASPPLTPAQDLDPTSLVHFANSVSTVTDSRTTPHEKPQATASKRSPDKSSGDKIPAALTPKQSTDKPCVTHSAESTRPVVTTQPERRHSLPVVHKPSVEGKKARPSKRRDQVTPVHRRCTGKSVRELSQMYESGGTTGKANAAKQTSPAATRKVSSQSSKLAGIAEGGVVSETTTAARKDPSSGLRRPTPYGRSQSHSKTMRRIESAQETSAKRVPRRKEQSRSATVPIHSFYSQNGAAPVPTTRGNPVPSTPNELGRHSRRRSSPAVPLRGTRLDRSRTVTVTQTNPNNNRNNNNNTHSQSSRHHQRSTILPECKKEPRVSVSGAQDEQVLCESCKGLLERPDTFELSWSNNAASPVCPRSSAGVRTWSPGYVATVTFTVQPEY